MKHDKNWVTWSSIVWWLECWTGHIPNNIPSSFWQTYFNFEVTVFAGFSANVNSETNSLKIWVNEAVITKYNFIVYYEKF